MEGGGEGAELNSCLFLRMRKGKICEGGEESIPLGGKEERRRRKEEREKEKGKEEKEKESERNLRRKKVPLLSHLFSHLLLLLLLLLLPPIHFIALLDRSWSFYIFSSSRNITTYYYF